MGLRCVPLAFVLRTAADDVAIDATGRVESGYARARVASRVRAEAAAVP